MIQEVKFQGLSSSPSDYDAQDGELGTCLNLINEDGALKPISKAQATESFTLPDTCSIKYVHKVTHDDEIHTHYIVNCTNGSPYSWYWTEKGGDGTTHEIALGDFQVNSVTAIGNIICFVGDSNTKYAYWKNDTYHVFDSTLFQYDITIDDDLTPKDSNRFYSVSCDFTQDWDDIWESNQQFSSTSGKAKSTASQIVFSGIDAMINKKIEEIDQYTFKYLSFGVVALKLYDGTYTNISMPFVLSPAFISNKFIWRDEKKTIGTYFNAHKHKITVKSNIPTELEDLVIGADVFLSQPESFLNTEDRFRTIDNASNFIYQDGMAKDVYSFAMDFLDREKVYTTIDNMSFYLSVSLEKGDFGTAKQLKRISEANQSISLADFKKKVYGGMVAYTYNNRLHIGNVKSSVNNAFSTFTEENFQIGTHTETSTDMYEMYLNNRLNVDEDKGNKGVTYDAVMAVTITVNNIDKTIYEKVKINYPITPILAYPDSNATQMVLYLPNAFKGGYMKKTMVLHQSSTMGMSYYVNLGNHRKTDTAWGNGSAWVNTFGKVTSANADTNSDATDPTIVLPDDENIPSFMNILYIPLKDYTYTPGTFGTGSDTTTVTIKKWDYSKKTTTDVFEDIESSEYNAAAAQVGKTQATTTSHSLVKVSEAENPLVFPAKNSVQVGSSTIYALASNTRPISEGQFGEAPLYAFTDEGVWVLMTSTEGTYTTRQPANREICNNPDGILQTDDAVLFPTERGIMMQRGRESTCITDSLDGYPFNYMDLHNADKVIATNSSIAASDIGYIKFRTFLESADMIYDYYNSRIIVFNPNYTYAYVYSLKSQMWGAMQSDFSKRINIYPESLAINKSGQIVDVYTQEPTADVPFFLCSRPLALSSNEVHKTIFSCIARGYFDNSKTNTCGIVLYGSNDLMNWYFIKSSVDKYLRGMAGSPYKYFRVALIGNLSPNESISGISTDIQERWQNKLR